MQGWVFILSAHICLCRVHMCVLICQGQRSTSGAFLRCFSSRFGHLAWNSRIWSGWMAREPQGYARICLLNTEMTHDTCEQPSLTVPRGSWELNSDPSHKLSTPLAESFYFPFTTSQLCKLQLREWLSQSHPMAAGGNGTWHPTVAMNPIPIFLFHTRYSFFLLYFKRHRFLYHCFVVLLLLKLQVIASLGKCSQTRCVFFLCSHWI